MHTNSTFSGLINNVLYVIILTAALDLVGADIPKGIVLLADVVPSFFTKLTAPYYIHNIPYHIRILVFVMLSSCGMLLIAITPATTGSGPVALKMLGVVLASLSSGGGELSFLGLTHFYGHFSLAAWGSGTGGAGLVGSWLYVFATTTLGVSSRKSMFLFSFLPVVMLISFFVILPRERLKQHTSYPTREYERVNSIDEEAEEESQATDMTAEDDRLLRASVYSTASIDSKQSKTKQALSSLQANLNRAKKLFFP
jgi:battenin